MPNQSHIGAAPPKNQHEEENRLSKVYTWPVLGLFLLVIGGIYGGVFTPTEAGGIGAFGALLVSLARRQMTGKSSLECLLEGAQMTAMIIALLIGAFAFNQFHF